MGNRALAGLLAIFLLGGGSSAWAEADPSSLKHNFRRPAAVPFPADNPYSADKAALGKALFFDPRVSGASNMTCTSCHNPSFGWSDGVAKATGSQAKPLARHSPTLLNMAWGRTFFWDGRAPSLEIQVVGPITAINEMNMPMDGLVERLKRIEGYRTWFERVFPGQGITRTTIPMALATYQRTIVSGRAPFDAWADGDENAISASAKRGFLLFTGKAGCSACHSGWTFSDEGFHDIGLSDADPGRAEVSKRSADRHAFKTPGLRNIRQRAPYMHDGSLDSLEMVIAHYATGGEERPSRSAEMKPFVLEQGELEDLTAFLDTLTGDDAPVSLPILPK